MHMYVCTAVFTPAEAWKEQLQCVHLHVWKWPSLALVRQVFRGNEVTDDLMVHQVYTVYNAGWRPRQVMRVPC